MFTGIVEGLGTLAGIRPSRQGSRLEIDTDFQLKGTQIGESIAVNGACLTAVSVSARRFAADVSPETLEKTTFGQATIGERVNLERALRLSDRIDGHLVSGHVDAKGIIAQKTASGNATIVTIEVPASVSRYIIQKGSVAVDGISLTVNRCDRRSFEVSIIPHTGLVTTVGFKKRGAAVNIETDLIGKYVERFVTGGHADNVDGGKSSIDVAFLAKNGFLS
jgi:riboflavin synthase